MVRNLIKKPYQNILLQGDYHNDGEDDLNLSDDKDFNTPAGSVNDNNSLGNIDEEHGYHQD